MDIAYYLEHPEALDDSTFHQLSKLVEEYPYYHAARLLLVKNAHKLQHESYEHELRKAAVLLPDRKPLFDLAKAKDYEIPQKPIRKPAAPAKDRMAALIDGFLDKQKEGQDSSKRMPTADPSADYMSYLFQQEAIAATVAVQYGVEAPPPWSNLPTALSRSSNSSCRCLLKIASICLSLSHLLPTHPKQNQRHSTNVLWQKAVIPNLWQKSASNKGDMSTQLQFSPKFT